VADGRGEQTGPMVDTDVDGAPRLGASGPASGDGELEEHAAQGVADDGVAFLDPSGCRITRRLAARLGLEPRGDQLLARAKIS